MKQESTTVDGVEVIRGLQASFVAYWTAQNLEDKTSFPLPRERQDIADLLATIDGLRPSHASLLAALEGSMAKDGHHPNCSSRSGRYGCSVRCKQAARAIQEAQEVKA